MSGHTPGPWVARLSTRIYDDTIVIDGKGKDRVVVIPADDTMEIEDGAIVESCSKEAKANARLVVAAPVLLAAVKLALLHFDEVIHGHRPSTPPLKYAAILRAARDEAEGK